MTNTRDVEALGGASASRTPIEAGEVPEEGGSRARRIAFRVLAVLTSLLVSIFMIFAVTEVVFMWLPWETLMSLIDDLPAADEIHRGHMNIAGIIAWALVLGVVVQLRKPERRVAPMLQAVGIVVAGAVVYGLSGTLGEWLVEEVTLLVPVLLLALLHPRAQDLVRCPRTDRHDGCSGGLSGGSLAGVRRRPRVAAMAQRRRRPPRRDGALGHRSPAGSGRPLVRAARVERPSRVASARLDRRARDPSSTDCTPWCTPTWRRRRRPSGRRRRSSGARPSPWPPSVGPGAKLQPGPPSWQLVTSSRWHDRLLPPPAAGAA